VGLQCWTVYRLTLPELTVLPLVATGKSGRDIVSVAGATHPAVQKHVSDVLGEIGVASATLASRPVAPQHDTDPLA